MLRVNGVSSRHRFSHRSGSRNQVEYGKTCSSASKTFGTHCRGCICTVCGKTFEAPLVALLTVKDAEASLQQQFYGHKCERKDAVANKVASSAAGYSATKRKASLSRVLRNLKCRFRFLIFVLRSEREGGSQDPRLAY